MPEFDPRSWTGPAGDAPFAAIFDMPAPPRPAIPDGPVVVAVAQDEMLRIPDYLRHHRAIGIRHFLIVDNASTDGTAAYLDAQPDVTRLYSERPFPRFKPLFRPWLADTYAAGRWVLAPDLDEHFVYPGWPEVPLERLIAHWEGRGVEAVFAPMVDMYADRPLTELSHGAEARLAATYPLFDAEGYWVAPPKPASLRETPTPPFILYGGARTRVGRGGRPALRQRLQRLAIRHLMDYRDPAHPRPGARLAHSLLMRHRGKTAGMKSKVPLIRWRRGLRVPGSNHRVNAPLRLAEEWGALLHFRLMVDYAVRETAWARRKGRGQAAPEERLEIDMRWEGSRRLHDWRDLAAAGLVRLGDDLRAELGLAP